MANEGINISGNTGDVIGVNVSGTGSIVGKNITTGSITISSQQLAGVANEYAKALEAFTQGVNQLLQKYQVPAERTEPVKTRLKELAEEVKDVKPDAPPSVVKQASITNRFTLLADAVVKMLPKGIELGTAFTPLAPFGKLIGHGVESLVKAIQNER